MNRLKIINEDHVSPGVMEHIKILLVELCMPFFRHLTGTRTAI